MVNNEKIPIIILYDLNQKIYIYTYNKINNNWDDKLIVLNIEKVTNYYISIYESKVLFTFIFDDNIKSLKFLLYDLDNYTYISLKNKMDINFITKAFHIIDERTIIMFQQDSASVL